MTRRELVAAMVASPLAVVAATELMGRQPAEDRRMHTAAATRDVDTPRTPAPHTLPGTAGLLVLYSSRSGHTRRIAGFLADRARRAGHAVTLEEVGAYAGRPPAPLPPAVILAASIQVGRYEDAVVQFVAQRGRSSNRCRPASCRSA